MRRLSWLLALALLGCGREVLDLDLLARPGMSSLLLATDDGGDLSLTAYPLVPGQPLAIEPLGSYVGAYPVTLTALFYQLPLTSLGLPAGPVEIVPSGQTLPSSDDAVKAEIRGAVIGEWLPVMELDRRLTEIRIPGLELDRCLADGGCLSVVDGRFSGCNLPCTSPTPVAAPIPPRPVKIGPCTHGWRSVTTVDGVEVCDPWPEGGRQTCGPGQAHFPGEPGCTSVGLPCGPGLYATELPPGPVRYVDPAAPNGGDGSLAAPYNTIERATSNASAGTVVALAKGTFAEAVVMKNGVTLAGACVETIIAPGTDATPVVATVDGRIQNLRLRGVLLGLEVTGAGTHFVADGIDFDGSLWDGFQVRDAATATISNSRIAATEGSYVQNAHATYRRVAMTRSVGVAIYGEGGKIRIHDSAFSDGQPFMDHYGHAIDVSQGSTMHADHVAIDDNLAFGIIIGDSEAWITDTVVRGTQHDLGAGDFGDGMEVLGSALVHADRIHLDHNARFNVFVSDRGSRLVLSNAVVTDTASGVDGADGVGILVQRSSTASISRAHFARSQDDGVRVTGQGTEATLFDVTVTDTNMRPRDQFAGDGIAIDGAGQLTAERIVVRRTGGIGVAVREGRSAASLTDVTVEDTGSLDCYTCAGICSLKSGSIEALVRAVVVGARGRGVSSGGTATNLTAEDLEVRGTIQSGECVTNNPTQAPRFGDGIGALEGGAIRVTRFLSTSNEGAGLIVEDFLGEGTSVDVADGEISFNGTGARVVPGYDARRLAVGVHYHDNRTNIGN